MGDDANDATAAFTVDDTNVAEESEAVHETISLTSDSDGDDSLYVHCSCSGTCAQAAFSAATTSKTENLPLIGKDMLNASDAALFYITTTPFDLDVQDSAGFSGSLVHLTRGMLIKAKQNHNATAKYGSPMWLITEVTLHGTPTPAWLSPLSTFTQGAHPQLRELDSFTVSCLLPLDATARDLDTLSPAVEFLRSAPILDSPTSQDVASHIVRVRTRSNALFRCFRTSMSDGDGYYTMVVVRNLANDEDQDLCTVADLILLSNSNDFSSEPSTSTAAPGWNHYKPNRAYGGQCTCRPVDLTDVDNSFFAIGDRVSVSLASTSVGSSANSELATIKWLGRIVGCQYYRTDQLLVGLELDKPNGTCDGAFHGFVLFEARAKHGLLVDINHINPVYDDWSAPLAQTNTNTSATGPSEQPVLSAASSRGKRSSKSSAMSANMRVSTSASAQKSALNTQGYGETPKLKSDRKRQENQDQQAAKRPIKVPRLNGAMKAATQSALGKLMTTNPAFDGLISTISEVLGTPAHPNSSAVASASSSAGALLAVGSATSSGAGSSYAGQVTEKADRRIELNDMADCKLCFAASKNALLQPCCHLAFCFECAGQLHRSGQPCPICRKSILSVLRIYDA